MSKPAAGKTKPIHTPDRGEVIHLDFDPAAGTEFAGPHYALVLSPLKFQTRTGLAIVLACTSQEKGPDHPQHRLQVPLPPAVKLPKPTFVWLHQIKALDYRHRRATFVGQAGDAFADRVAKIVAQFLGLPAVAY